MIIGRGEGAGNRWLVVTGVGEAGVKCTVDFAKEKGRCSKEITIEETRR